MIHKNKISIYHKKESNKCNNIFTKIYRKVLEDPVNHNPLLLDKPLNKWKIISIKYKHSFIIILSNTKITSHKSIINSPHLNQIIKNYFNPIIKHNPNINHFILIINYYYNNINIYHKRIKHKYIN
jgi:hypothetical protein